MINLKATGESVALVGSTVIFNTFSGIKVIQDVSPVPDPPAPTVVADLLRTLLGTSLAVELPCMDNLSSVKLYLDESEPGTQYIVISKPGDSKINAQVCITALSGVHAVATCFILRDRFNADYLDISMN